MSGLQTPERSLKDYSGRAVFNATSGIVRDLKKFKRAEVFRHSAPDTARVKQW